jgi:hypothetical protein
MLRVATTALLFTAAMGPAPAQDRLAHPAIDMKGHLYRAVFFSEPDALTADDIAALPEELHARLNRFLTRSSAFHLTDDSKRTVDSAVAIEAKKRVLERAIVSLLEREDASALAMGFLAEAPIAAEWGPTPEAPLEEAAHAEKRLKPDDPLAPFLYVFIAHRQRAAFEAADRKHDTDTVKAAAKKYRAVILRARGTQDPIYALLADDLDRLPYVHLKTDSHPGTFNPDT